MKSKKIKKDQATIDISTTDDSILECRGKWILSEITRLEKSLPTLQWPKKTSLIIDASSIEKMDSAGAWVLHKIVKLLEVKKIKVTVKSLQKQHQEIYELITAHDKETEKVPEKKHPTILYEIGKKTVDKIKRIPYFLEFLGEVSVETYHAVFDPTRIYWRSIVTVVESTGYRALPIIALLSFLVGIVIAYQMGLQLKNYGANIFIVDLVGLATFREFGPMITAIILAGRSGSAFTAQIGTMKINEEIDALQTMGVKPIDILVLPKMFGMLIALPLLTVWADIFGVLGGMVMANNMLDINFKSFLDRFNEAVSTTSYYIGLVKSPAFAIVITIIGCYQGFQVTLGADSVGRQTTRSVVQAIFFIIVIDAIFSVYFSWRKL